MDALTKKLFDTAKELGPGGFAMIVANNDEIDLLQIIIGNSKLRYRHTLPREEIEIFNADLVCLTLDRCLETFKRNMPNG